MLIPSVVYSSSSSGSFIWLLSRLGSLTHSVIIEPLLSVMPEMKVKKKKRES